MTSVSIDVAAPAPGALPGMVDGRVGRRARLEEVLAGLCLLAVVIVDVVLLRVGLDAMDEGYFIEQATRVMRGELPYRDFASFYTPGLLYLNAAVFNLLGETHVIFPRVIGLVARVLLAGGLYFICRPLTRPVFAILPGLYVLVALDSAPRSWEPHPGWPSAALTVLAVWAFSRLPSVSRDRRPLWLIAIGALSGLVFVFKQNAGVFLVVALVAFVAWQGIDARRATATRALRVTQLLLLVSIVGAAAWLIHPTASGTDALYFLTPLAAAGIAANARVTVASDGRSLGAWLRAGVWLGIGWAVVTVPWFVALLVALDGRLELLRGFVGGVDHWLLWHPLIGPIGGAWASLLGIAVAALLALRQRHRLLSVCAAMVALAVFAASTVLLTAEPGETIVLAALMAPRRASIGLPSVLPVLSILAGAWLSMRLPPTLATWQLRWLTVAAALTFLTQYPRADDVHLAWSACLPLATGAVVLGHLHAALAVKWNLGRMGRAVLAVLLIAVPAASVLPGLASRGYEFVDVAAAGRLAPQLEPTTTEMSLPSIEGLIVTEELSATLLAAIAYVQANTEPGEPIFVYPSSPLVYVAAERPNPTRFAHVYPGAASAEEVDGMIATLDKRQVRTVVVSGKELAFWGEPGGNQPLETYLTQTYHEVARFGPYRVLTRN